MKYYYGNSMKEALSNEPVEIRTTKQLQDYEREYNVVVPARDFKESKKKEKK